MTKKYIQDAVNDLAQAVTTFCEKANGVKVEYLVEHREFLQTMFWTLDENTHRIDEHTASVRSAEEYDEIMRAQAALRGQIQ
jgi:type IV secretory pathway TrbF-like protein